MAEVGSTQKVSRRRTKHDSRARTRTGCRKCRERRVKCPEQRPICRSCQRLGFTCSYELSLSWLEPEVRIYSSRKGSTTAEGWRASSWVWPVETWMFLNATTWDFQADGEAGVDGLEDPRCASVSPKPQPSVPWLPVLDPLAVEEDLPVPIIPPRVHVHPKRTNIHPQVPRYLPFSSLPASDLYLWTYFDRYVTPQCVLNPDFNPYRDIILRIAESSQDGPLFQCVLAVAANQLHSVGFVKYKSVMWLHRAKALHLLRMKLSSGTTTPMVPQPYDLDAEDQIIATTLMLCFFEILQNCSRSWLIHTKFAGGFLLSGNNRPLTYERQLLRQFALTYIHSHSILAATAGTEADNSISNAVGFANASIVQALTGCSEDILTSISEINRLGSLMQGEATCQDADMVRQSRNDIERRLHQYGAQPNPRVPTFDSEFTNVAEVKRLATLLYLYSRIDLSGPQESHMVRISTQILSLLPKISLRTNTILWPLFIVAVLGIRPECDEDRKVVLARLHALQETRQLGNVKKARGIIMDVWKARDMHSTDINKGWSILEGRDQGLSLA